MLAALFRSYGKGTRLDRFLPVSTTLLKKSISTACLHPCRRLSAKLASIVGVETISCRSLLLSSSVVFAFFVV